MTNQELKAPKYKAILIGGPCDGKTYSLHTEESVILAIDPTKTTPIREFECAPEFGSRPAICEYVLKVTKDTHMLKSVVRTYFYNKTVQDPYA
jgi:hypothetical protein